MKSIPCTFNQLPSKPKPLKKSKYFENEEMTNNKVYCLADGCVLQKMISDITNEIKTTVSNQETVWEKVSSQYGNGLTWDEAGLKKLLELNVKQKVIYNLGDAYSVAIQDGKIKIRKGEAIVDNKKGQKELPDYAEITSKLQKFEKNIVTARSL